MNNQSELKSIPESDNRLKSAKQNLELLLRSNSLIYIIVVIVLVICSFLLGTWYGKQKASLVENVTKTDKNEVTKYNPLEKSVEPTPTIIPPDYSAESAKTRTVFDLSMWKTYENTEIGLRFKYPSEWGRPKGELSTCDNPELCSNDGEPATTFLLKFPNSEFQIGGGSKNFTPHRGTNILHDFTGFSTWYSPEEVCKIPWFIFCQQTDNKVNYVSTPACTWEPYSGFGYERVLLIDLPNKKVNGLAFGGDFIPKGLMDYPFISCDEQTKKVVGNAIISRKLNSEIMKSFDTFEKVFETIEIY